MYKSVFQKSRYLSSVAFPGIVLLFSVLPGYATDYITKIDGTYPATILNGGDTVTVSGTGPNAAALSSIGAGSAIIVNGGGIIASNTNGTGGGVVRTDTGGYIDLGTGSVINGTGFGSASGMMGATGIEANDVGSAVTARDVTISLQSDYSHGVYSRNSGSITLYGNTTVNIANNDGANNSGAYGLVTLNSGASITAENADITITGISGDYAGFSQGIAAWEGSISVSGNIRMAIEGQGAQGIYADISGSSVIVNNLEGTVTGRTSGGAATGLSSDGGDILAQGNINLNVAADDEAFGIVSNEGNISLTGSSAQMQVTAANTTGLLTGGGGSHITADNLMMSVTGATFAVAIRNSTSVAGMSSIVVNNSHFSSNKDGVIVDSGTLNLIMNNSTMSNGSGMAFIINDSVGHQSYLNLIASNSHFSGAAVTGAASLLDLDLRSGSTWLVTGDSNLTNLVNDNSHITFAGGAFKTLTVQNYTGNNGYMTMNAHLAGDGSASDKLVIDGGSATGHTFLNIVNAGGMGAMTMGDGILVVETVNGSTIAANAFTLGGRVAAGAYEYTLHRGGSASSENWYLRNSFVDASGQVVPKYRTEVPLAYSIMPAMSDYGLLMAGTLHERVGESRNVLAKTQAAVAPEIVCFKSSMQCIETKGTEQGAVNEGFFHGGWGRVIGRHGEQSGENFQKTGSRYDYDFGAIQAGIDLYGKEDEAGNWDKFGAYFGYGRAKSNVKGVYQGKAGHVDTDMYSLGAYYTHMAASGWYTDTVLQASWYKNDVSSIDGQKLDPDGFGLLASVEAGYAFRFGNGLSLEPQAQIVYQRISLDDVSDANGRFGFDDTDSLRARIGLRVVKDWSESGPHISTWLRGNIWHEFNGDSKMSVATLAGTDAVYLSSSHDGTWGEIEAGISGTITDSTKLFASASYSHSFGNDNKGSDWGGQIGFTYNW